MANSNSSQLIIYQSEDGKTKLDVRLDNETVWLNQKMMADLFQTTKQNISLHLKNIFAEGELSEESVVKEYLLLPLMVKTIPIYSTIWMRLYQ